LKERENQKFFMLHSSVQLDAAKGQLISGAIFLCFNSSKKQTKYLQNFALKP
jgi:hypothetical protein